MKEKRVPGEYSKKLRREDAQHLLHVIQLRGLRGEGTSRVDALTKTGFSPELLDSLSAELEEAGSIRREFSSNRGWKYFPVERP